MVAVVAMWFMERALGCAESMPSLSPFAKVLDCQETVWP
jgi:hypothetical protein